MVGASRAVDNLLIVNLLTVNLLIVETVACVVVVSGVVDAEAKSRAGGAAKIIDRRLLMDARLHLSFISTTSIPLSLGCRCARIPSTTDGTRESWISPCRPLHNATRLHSSSSLLTPRSDSPPLRPV